ncbi:MAG: threonine aldolase family protein [Acidimicrobiales bacterium]
MTRLVDLRSDTVTQPTAAMREAMASAPVGDDGYGEDPTVNALETRAAMILGKPAAVFTPSGVMANQMAVRVLTEPGDVIVAGANQHLVDFEMGASARNSSVQFALVEDATGQLDLDRVVEIIESEADHRAHVGAVAVENTHMPSGGTPWPVEQLAALARAVERPVHLDGARLFNAAVATATPAAALAAPATTVMVCLSKGLGAPVGSLLAGPADLMARARVERKRLGGAMRQAGVLAAAGIVALETMVDRLADDHRRARRLAELVAEAFPESQYDPASCRTNIVAFDHPDARALVAELAEVGVLGGTLAPRRVRLVTHLGVDDDDLDYVAEVLARRTR